MYTSTISNSAANEPRLTALEAENARLRALLGHARRQTVMIAQRHERLGRFFLAERDANRAAADRVAAENLRIRREAERAAEVYELDLDELKETEARQTLLMQELSHRVKNTLAMVQAIAAQTLRNAVSLDAAAEALGARLAALAQAHDVLIQGSWSSVDLHGLVEGTIELHGDGERFRVTGPNLTLGPRPGLTFALMLHELGTNAAKYGALSTASGHVAIEWDVEEYGGEAQLRFRWEERGGPPVAPPTRSGFGSRLIERSLVQGFGGSVSLTYPETGAILALRAPLSAVLAGTS
ncbi:two-component sensor histidine kinase [Methylobacterium sp. BE186]|uniref:sensor histidine kinase n=1 Tax=Methylobacterium sp. BE186 TaxID=2817715 RepID=UPI00285618E1|nr:sensor histidine kinase [Methylobacterium sp. BE186]MDR7036862.1 two-component sensor histidine kinase [Methylobacterium sp. BE186]